VTKLSAKRRATGLSQARFADLCGWSSQSRVSNYETGKRIPDIFDARRILSALHSCGIHCSLDDIFPMPANDPVFDTNDNQPNG
jgi:putative transcriptional regulator